MAGRALAAALAPNRTLPKQVDVQHVGRRAPAEAGAVDKVGWGSSLGWHKLAADDGDGSAIGKCAAQVSRPACIASAATPPRCRRPRCLRLAAPTHDARMHFAARCYRPLVLVLVQQSGREGSRAPGRGDASSLVRARAMPHGAAVTPLAPLVQSTCATCPCDYPMTAKCAAAGSAAGEAGQKGQRARVLMPVNVLRAVGSASAAAACDVAHPDHRAGSIVRASATHTCRSVDSSSSAQQVTPRPRAGAVFETRACRPCTARLVAQSPQRGRLSPQVGAATRPGPC